MYIGLFYMSLFIHTECWKDYVKKELSQQYGRE